MVHVLAGDIGGTKVLLAVFRVDQDRLVEVRGGRFASRDYDSLDSLLAEFLVPDTQQRLAGACFAVAGPVIDGACTATNLPWHLEEKELAVTARASPTRLVNDVQAAAWAMPRLPESSLAVINAGETMARRGNAVLIAAGTGLGEALLYWDGERHHAIATEGGHADFAPHSDVEIDFLRFLRAKFGGHVSFERVLSGPGLVNIHEFLREARGVPVPAWLARALAQGDAAAVIAEAALAKREPICIEALDVFAHIYGVEAGNLALKCLALGGVYLGGGIAPQILPVLRQGAFMRGFTDKGRFAELLSRIRVLVSLESRAALIGAGHFAADLATESGPTAESTGTGDRADG